MHLNVSMVKIAESIIEAALSLIQKGLIAGTWGNISVRVSQSQYAITPSGRKYQSLQPQDITVVNTDGTIVSGVFKPSSELPLHLAIYSARPDVQAIVHTHSVYASACAVAHRSIPPIIEDLVQLAGGSVDVAEYAFPGTADLGKNAVSALQDKYAVLLANHGVVGCGSSLAEAVTACELVEKAAQIYILAHQIGKPHILNQHDIDSMHKFYLEQYKHRQEDKTNESHINK